MSGILKKNWLNQLGGVLIALSIAPFAGAIYALVSPAFSAKCFNFDTIRAAVEWATLSGILMALGATLRVQSKDLADKKEQRSRFYLDSCLDAYERAGNILEDGNNDRAKWVRAARVLMLAKNLEKSITQESHLRVFEVHRLEYRYLFSEIIDKPGIHFYGVSPRVMKEIGELDREKMLDEAEERSRELQFSNNPYEKHAPDVYPLPEEALYAVWQAARWPDDYTEPLRGLKFSEEERLMLISSGLGIAEYLDHKEVKRARDLKKNRGEN